MTDDRVVISTGTSFCLCLSTATSQTHNAQLQYDVVCSVAITNLINMRLLCAGPLRLHRTH